MEKDQYIKELNMVLKQAKARENWAVALRACELIAKSSGWLGTKSPEVMSIKDYPLETLEKWLAEIEAEATELGVIEPDQLPKVARHKKILVRGKRGGS